MTRDEAIGYLGYPVVDKVTGFKGVVVSVTFDLYGCTQVLVHPGLDEKGGVRDAEWFDINRLEVVGDRPVMKSPHTATPAPSVATAGPADKPRRGLRV